MKKFISLLCIGIISVGSLMMSGCSTTPLSQGQIDLQESAYTAKTSCYQRLQIRDQRLTTMLGRVPKDQIALVLVLTQMQDSNKQLMAIATGNSSDECSTGTTAFDVQIAEVESKNAVVGKAVGVTGETIKMALGVYGAVEIVGSVADASGIKVIGDSNSVSTATDNAHIGGSRFNTDKSGTGNSGSNIDSNLTSEKDSRNTITTEADNRNTNINQEDSI